jgi:hypothetical protein
LQNPATASILAAAAALPVVQLRSATALLKKEDQIIRALELLLLLLHSLGLITRISKLQVD